MVVLNGQPLECAIRAEGHLRFEQHLTQILHVVLSDDLPRSIREGARFENSFGSSEQMRSAAFVGILFCDVNNPLGIF
jgi:hypothetical protein